ncbi:MAG: amino acid racemase [Bacteroidales bacterium]|nr:amino acid racemase [Bacteroidales bacterium]
MKGHVHKHIGIIGGMGMESSILMQKKMLEYHTINCNNCPYPKLTFFPVNLKKVINFQVYNKMNEYVEYLSDCIFILEKAGCEFVSIAAVTPHILYNELVKKSNLPILHIVENSLDQILKLDNKEILVLATSYTNKSGIISEKLNPLGFQLKMPIKEDQEMLDYIIYHKLVKGIHTNVEKEMVSSLVRQYNTKNVLLACTDLSVLELKETKNISFIDLLDNHARKTLHSSLSNIIDF